MSIDTVSSRRSIKSKLLYTALVAVTIGTTTWWGVVESYSAPHRTAEAIPFQTQSSSFVIPVVMNLDDLQRRLNQDVPEVLASVDENRDGCVPATWVKVKWLFGLKTKATQAIDCNLKGQAVRGPITLGGNGKTLTITMPVSASITAKGRGEIGKHIQTTATGAITATANVQADIDENWNPSAIVSADYSWNNRIGVNVLGFRITFADKVDPQLRKMIEGFQKKIPEALARLTIKDHASKLWKNSFATLQVGKDPNLWVKLTPEVVGYNGYSVSGRELKFSIMASGRTETYFGQQPAPAVATELPGLKRDLPAKGLNVFVPVSVDYTTLANAAKSALKVGEEQSFEIPGRGNVKATFKDVVIHQTDGRRLAIGVTLDSNASVGFLNLSKARGTVWFVADVNVDNLSKRAKVDRFEAHGKTDSATANILTSILNLPAVNRALLNCLQYDFSAKYSDAIRQVEDGINRQVSSDLRLAGKIDGIEVESIVAGPGALIANVSAKGQAEIRTDKLVN